MGRGPHLYRRGAVYYWQRRLPPNFAARLQISHFRLSLETKDAAEARRLVPALDAVAVEVFMGDAERITQEQLGNLFKAVLVQHKGKLADLADYERAKPLVPRPTLLKEEIAQGFAHVLLSKLGATATLSSDEEQRLRDEGRDDAFIADVRVNLGILSDGKSIKVSPHRIARRIEEVGAKPSPMNVARAQPIYLRAIGEALLAAEERYGDEPISEVDFDALMDEIREKARVGHVAVPAIPAPVDTPLLEKPEPVVEIIPPPSQLDPEDPESILAAAKALGDKRSGDEEWDPHTHKQANFIFGLFARFMFEVHEVWNFTMVKQKHIAAFDTFMRGVHSNFGKSSKDPYRTIAEIRVLAVTEGEKHGTLKGATRNRHLTFLEQLIKYARDDRGIAIDPKVTTSPFRARKNTRGRDQREIPTQDQVELLFAQPVFHGYKDWKHINVAGDEFYHRGEYYCSILAAYLGGRREEYCGLSEKDVIEDNGDIPYVHIAPNDIRRIKNKQSIRNVALHPEPIRLGFLDYVKAIRDLGYDRLFPDLYSPSTKSPMGDRYYDQMLQSLRAAGFTPHQIRHFFGDELKQKEVSDEFRADFLGHGGKTETTERYCSTLRIALQMPKLMKLPIVTGHLEPRPIKLLPWVVAKEIAPWSRVAQRARKASKAAKK
jgi:integrase